MYPKEIQAAEASVAGFDAADVDSLKNQVIDFGARLQQFGKWLSSKAAPEDHAIIEATIAELCEMVGTLFATADVFGSHIEFLKTMLEAIKED